MITIARAAFVVAAGMPVVLAASPYKVDTRDDVVASVRTMAHDLVSYYKGNQTGQVPGLLPGPPPSGPYYWWHGAVFWSTLIDYWHLTGDDSYNKIITEALLWQGAGTTDTSSFLPPNQTASLGNDDQCTWALAALLAAENRFPDPPNQAAGWVKAAQNVFEQQYARYQMEVEKGDCEAGGLRWQIPLINTGYDYKNTMSNGCFFNLAAHLFRYTGNTTYFATADKTFSWMQKIGFIDSKTWAIYDGGHVQNNCTDINKAQFTYPSALILQGAAFIYNQTGGNSPVWKTNLDNLLDAILKYSFKDGVAFEPACETGGRCTSDMIAFKGYLLRFLGTTAQVAPYTRDKIKSLVTSTAKAAAAHCSGGSSGRACGFSWLESESRKSNATTDGLGEQLTSLAAVESLLFFDASGPVTNATKDSAPAAAGGGGGGGKPGGGNPSGAGKLEMGSLMMVAGLFFLFL